MTTITPAFAAALAAALAAGGEAWAAAPHRHHDTFHTLRGPAGEEVVIRPDRRPRRLTLSGSFWPGGEDLYRHLRHDAPPCTITVAADRPPSAVAAELRRRLLPAYRAELAEARARKVAHDAQEAFTSALARELSSFAGGRTHPDQPCRFSTSYTADGYSLLGEVLWGGEVRLDLTRLTPDQARRVLAALARP